MKLINLLDNIKSVDEELIIFIENEDNINSDIILSFCEEGARGVKVENGIEYYYLIEVFLAKEFIADWVANLGYSPNSEEIAKRLYQYTINDA